MLKSAGVIARAPRLLHQHPLDLDETAVPPRCAAHAAGGQERTGLLRSRGSLPEPQLETW